MIGTSTDQLLLKGSHRKDATQTVNTKNVQLFPSAGFISWFCQYLYKRRTFLLRRIWKSSFGAQLLHDVGLFFALGGVEVGWGKSISRSVWMRILEVVQAAGKRDCLRP